MPPLLSDVEKEMLELGVGEKEEQKPAESDGPLQTRVLSRAAAEREAAEGERTAKRMKGYEMQQMRFRREENTQKIDEDVKAGRLTEEQAKELRARQALHRDGKMNELDRTLAGANYDATASMVLEEFLDQRDELTTSPFLMHICVELGIDKIHAAAMASYRRRRHPNYKHACPLIAKIVGSTCFELIVALTMAGNGLLIGFQVSYEHSEEMGGMFDLMEHAFTIFFVIEILLRIISDGWHWLWDRGNFADVLLIFLTGVLPMWILKPIGVQPGLLRVFAVLRVLRLIRLVKMVRTKPAFRIFWSLIQGILDSGKTLLYTYVMITMVLYVFAIFSVYLIARDENFKDDEVAQLYFGDVPAAMFTLFQIITLDNWADVCRDLMKKSSLVAPFIIVVIGVVTLVLLNLVIAVIVNNAFERAKKDDDLLAVQKKTEMISEIKSLENLFRDIDLDGNDTLSKAEYDHAVRNNQTVKDKFNILQVEENEYDEIWKLLDDSKDGSGEVSISSFAHCLRDMKGGAKAKDSFSILRKVHGLNTRLARLRETLTLRQRYAEELRNEALQVKKQLGGLQHDMCEFVQLISNCIPATPIKVKRSVIESHIQTVHDKVRNIQ